MLLDTVDKSVSGQFFENLEHVLGNRPLDYMIVNHMEPDHCAIVEEVVRRFPEVKVVGNAKTFNMMKQFFTFDVDAHAVVIKEGDTISTGKHTLAFAMIPMVHWPEAMVTYDAYDKVLFSADAFGTFGALNGNVFADEVNFKEEWLDDARRYYTNIVGKYGASVQALLKKASGLEIAVICPLHGPVLTGEALGEALRLYDLWSRWQSESPDDILLAHASIHGNTARAAELLKQKLEAKGARVTLCDLTTTEVSYAVANAFYCGKLVLACSTYDGGLFPPMEEFLSRLQAKGFRDRSVGLIENGSWAPAAARLMRAKLEEMKDLRVCGTVVSLRSALGPANEAQMEALSAELCAK